MFLTRHAEERLRDCGLRPQYLRKSLQGLSLPDGKHKFPVDGTGEVTFVVTQSRLVTVLRPGMS